MPARTILAAVLALSAGAGCAVERPGLRHRAAEVDLTDGQVVGALSAANQRVIDLAEVVYRRAARPDLVEASERILFTHGALSQRIEDAARALGVDILESPVRSAIVLEAERQRAALDDAGLADPDRALREALVDAERDLLALVDEVLAPSAVDARMPPLLREAREVARRNLEALR